MEISDKPRLINDSIVFEDEDGTFVYGQTIKKVANCKKFNDFAFKELRRQGFFVSAPVVENTNRKFSSLILLLSRDCLLCCRYCYADAGTSKAMMSAKVAEKAVEWYLANKPLRPKVSFIGGGEPTLNTAVLTNLINKYGDRLHWVVTTSGVVSERFLNWLMDNKVSVSFSIDGPPYIQDYLRPLKGGGNSSSFVEASASIWKSKRPLNVRATLTNDTIIKIDEILTYFKVMGVDTLHLETLYNLGRATKNTSFVKQPATKSWIGAVITALDWARQNNKRLAVHALIHLFNPGLNSFCGPMRGNAMVVNHEGRLTACSEVVDRVNKDWDLFCLGELDKTPKVDVEKLEYLASRTPANMSICENCFAKYICRGGCAYKGLVESGDLFIPDNRHCEFVKNIIPILIKRMVLNS